jgi:hypothetical protein
MYELSDPDKLRKEIKELGEKAVKHYDLAACYLAWDHMDLENVEKNFQIARSFMAEAKKKMEELDGEN